MKKPGLRLRDDEHEALTMLAEMIGHSLNTTVRAVTMEACRRFAREPHTIKALVDGYELGSPEADI